MRIKRLCSFTKNKKGRCSQERRSVPVQQFRHAKSLRAGFEPTIHEGPVSRSFQLPVSGFQHPKKRDTGHPRNETGNCSRPAHYQVTLRFQFRVALVQCFEQGAHCSERRTMLFQFWVRKNKTQNPRNTLRNVATFLAPQ